MLINDVQAFDGVLRWIDDQDRIALDTETTGLDPYRGDRICGVALYNNGQHLYLPFRHGQGVNLPTACLQPLMDRLARMKALMVTFNGKFDLHMMFADGFPMPANGRVHDVMLAAHLIDENEETFALKRLSDKYLGDTSSRDEQELKGLIEHRFKSDLVRIRKGLPTKSQDGAWKALMWKLYPEEVADYAESDVRLTMLLEDYYAGPLEAWRITHLYEEVCNYLLLITRMENRGCLLDRDFMHSEMEQAEPRMQAALDELQDYIGMPINPNSPVQLKRFFGWGTTKKEVLEDLIESKHVQAPIMELVLAYRDYSKQKSSYYGKYLEMMDSSCTIRPSFQLTGTYTGRLSCWNPNLQSVPRMRSTNRVKSAFIARPGYELVEGDYSQAELRTFCFYSGERALAEILLSGGDLHSETAALLGIPRFAAKRMNFSIVYGVGKARLAEMLGIPEDVAAKYLMTYHGKFRGFKRLYYEQERIASNYGYIRLATGRVRHFNRDANVTPTHKASSNLIQGTVAEMVRVAMQRLERETAGADVHMLLQVHDSILLEIPEGTADFWIPRFREVMEGFAFDPAPKVDFKSGTRWGELHEWTQPDNTVHLPTKQLAAAS